jgi:putative membrane protein
VAHPAAGWSNGSVLDRGRVEIVLVLGVLLTVYGIGWWRMRRRASGAVKTWAPTYYLSGIGAAGLALLPPIDRLAEQFLVAHMIQHLLLIKVAAPCLLLANPLPAVLWGLPGFLRGRVGSLLTARAPLRVAGRMLTAMPLTWLTYALTLWFWHLPIAYDAALAIPALHDAEHLAFLAAALLFWWPLIRPAPHVRPKVGPGLCVGYMVLAAFQEALLGLLLMLSPAVLYRWYAEALSPTGIDPIDDQTWAGILMWGAGGAIDMIVALALLYRLLGSRAQPRAERSSDACTGVGRR